MPKKIEVKINSVKLSDIQTSTKDFNVRLSDFGPELGAFLKNIWKLRNKFNLEDFEEGRWQIYGQYSGQSANKNYDYEQLKSFIKKILMHADGRNVRAQGFKDKYLAEFKKKEIKTYGNALWTDFFHVLGKKRRDDRVGSRVYVHAASSDASLEIMKKIIDQFDNLGLDAVKTVGPGSLRQDTIVAYLYGSEDAAKLIKVLTEWKKPELFVDSLPPLIRKEGKGIGTADEPPSIRIDAEKREEEEAKRHSFGSFYSILIWLALKCTPNVTKKDKDQQAPDGRHMLDYMMHSLRMLDVDPARPQSFPKADKLERWYATFFESAD